MPTPIWERVHRLAGVPLRPVTTPMRTGSAAITAALPAASMGIDQLLNIPAVRAAIDSTGGAVGQQAGEWVGKLGDAAVNKAIPGVGGLIGGGLGALSTLWTGAGTAAGAATGAEKGAEIGAGLSAALDASPVSPAGLLGKAAGGAVGSQTGNVAELGSKAGAALAAPFAQLLSRAIPDATSRGLDLGASALGNPSNTPAQDDARRAMAMLLSKPAALGSSPLLAQKPTEVPNIPPPAPGGGWGGILGGTAGTGMASLLGGGQPQMANPNPLGKWGTGFMPEPSAGGGRSASAAARSNYPVSNRADRITKYGAWGEDVGMPPADSPPPPPPTMAPPPVAQVPMLSIPPASLAPPTAAAIPPPSQTHPARPMSIPAMGQARPGGDAGFSTITGAPLRPRREQYSSPADVGGADGMLPFGGGGTVTPLDRANLEALVEVMNRRPRWGLPPLQR